MERDQRWENVWQYVSSSPVGRLVCDLYIFEFDFRSNYDQSIDAIFEIIREYDHAF